MLRHPDPYVCIHPGAWHYRQRVSRAHAHSNHSTHSSTQRRTLATLQTRGATPGRTEAHTRTGQGTAHSTQGTGHRASPTPRLLGTHAHCTHNAKRA